MNTLLFVYNAKSGKFNALFDAGHKLFSPNTYHCKLCALTFNTFSENKQWKKFREESKINMLFYHIDEFEKNFPNTSFEYPVVLKQIENDLTVFLSKESLNVLDTVDSLINEILKQVHDANITL
jgi:hypothetical protein